MGKIKETKEAVEVVWKRVEKEFAVWLECEGLEDVGDKRLMRLCCGK